MSLINDLSIPIILNMRLPLIVEDNDSLLLLSLCKTIGITIAVTYTTNMPAINTIFNVDPERQYVGVLPLKHNSYK